ncbi:MAG: hypothetical protein RLZZ282_376 [Verrucomicrobiota bacterium]|jgi:uncharacterized protein (DUF3084 family)
MKPTLTTACFAALLTLGNLANAQTTAFDTALADPNHEAPPPTTKMRVETLKARQTESLATLTTALNRISSDPALVTAKETFAAIEKADRDMVRSKCASDSILAALRSELATIKKDSAFADDQKTELETAASAMANECTTVRKEADVVIKNLAKAYKTLAQAKKIHKSYLNLQGERQAKENLKAAVEEYVKTLTESTSETPAAEAPKEEGKSA